MESGTVDLQSSKSIWAITGACIGGLTGGPPGAAAGSVIGGMLGTILDTVFGESITKAVIQDLRGAFVEEKVYSRIKGAVTKVFNHEEPPINKQVNHDLQMAFRDALREAICDIGGKATFPQQWQQSRRETPSHIIYFVKFDNNVDIEIAELLKYLYDKIDEILPLNAPPELLTNVGLYLDTYSADNREFRTVFWDAVLQPHLKTYHKRALAQDPSFERHLKRHLFARTLVHLGENLKQSSEAWRALNRMVFHSMFEAMKESAQNDVAILAQLDAVQKQLDTRNDSLDMESFGKHIADFGDQMSMIELGVNEIISIATRQTAQQIQILYGVEEIKASLIRLEGKVDQVGITVNVIRSTSLQADSKLDLVLQKLDEQADLFKRVQPLAPGYQAQPPPYMVPDELFDFFVGREKEIEEVKSYLRSEQRLCIIHGLPGVGKSYLANFVASSIRKEYPQGIYWATLNTDVTEGNHDSRYLKLIKNFSSALGVDLQRLDNFELQADGRDWISSSSLSARTRSQLEAIKSRLRHQNCLIVLDGIKDSEELRLLAPLNSGCTILATTLNAYVLNRNSTRVKLEPLKKNEATKLLSLFDPRVNSSENKRDTQQIVELVGGLPIALISIGKHLQSGNSVGDYLDQFKEQSKLFVQLSKRDQQLKIPFELAYQQIPLETRTLFARLSIFANFSFSSDVLPILTSQNSLDSIEMMGSLDQLELVHKTEVEIRLLSEKITEKEIAKLVKNLRLRYQMHALISAFAKTKFVDNFDDLKKQIATYYVGLTSNFKVEGFRLLDFEWNILHDLLKWCDEKSEFSLALHLIDNLTYPQLGRLGFVDTYGYWIDVLPILEKILESDQIEMLSSETTWLLVKAGIFSLKLGQLSKGKRFLNQVVNSKDQTNDPLSLWAISYALAIQAEIFRGEEQERQTQDFAQAKALLTASKLPIAKQEIGWIDFRLGTLYARKGEIDAAEGLLTTALKSLPSTPSSLSAGCHINLANIWDIRGQSREAEKELELADKIATEIGDNWLIAGINLNLGYRADNQGRFADAESAYLKALSSFSNSGSIGQAIQVQNNLSLLYIRWHELQKALKYAEIADSTYRSLDDANSDPEIEKNIQLNRAHISILMGDLDNAKLSLDAVWHNTNWDDGQFNEIQIEYFYLSSLLNLAEKDLKSSLESIEPVINLAEADESALWLGISQRLKGEIFVQSNKPANDIADTFQVSVNTLADYPYEQAKTHLAWGKYELQQTNHTAAKEHFESALSIFKKVKSKKDIQTTSDILAQLPS